MFSGHSRRVLWFYVTAYVKVLICGFGIIEEHVGCEPGEVKGRGRTGTFLDVKSNGLRL